MRNSLGRELPEHIEGYGALKPFTGVFPQPEEAVHPITEKMRRIPREGTKILSSLSEAIKRCGLRNGMTISFHHHLRNGDYVLNMVLEEAAQIGLKDLKVAMSAVFPIHEPLVKHMKDGVVTKLVTSYISGPVAEAVSRGVLPNPIIIQTHGGRVRAIETGELKIDVAFIAAPACDEFGNLNGTEGPSAFGVVTYPEADAFYAAKTVVITDNLVSYPACPIEISQEYVDYIVQVPSIGNVQGIVSGTTRITSNPIGLKIAKMAARVIQASGLLKDGFSFQTGAGGISLAVAAYVRELMKKAGIQGSFAAGGITGYHVEMLEEGLFRTLLDAQCFDLKAVNSLRVNRNHQRMSISMYANPHNKGAVVDKLDVMILGATEIDTNFNVNVTTNSNGILMGGPGGHSDTAAGAKLAIVVTQLVKKRFPIVLDAVTTVTTPGETIDAVVTERGIAVNPRREDLLQKLSEAKLPIYTIGELKEIAQELTGVPDMIATDDRIVAVMEYRDGTVIDVVRKIIT